MKIFITGGSGFLGQHLLKRWQLEGHQVTALSRNKTSDDKITAWGAQPIRGTLQDIRTWAKALTGQDLVVHAAAPIDVWGQWPTFQQEIVEASLLLYQLANYHHVKRFIYISSESVLQSHRPLLDIDENYAYPLEPNSLYGKAKKQAEQQLILHASMTTLIILRPTFIWGHGDSQFEHLLHKVKHKQFVWVDHGHVMMEMVHVDNVVEAIALAMHRGMHKAIYFVTDGQAMLVREFLGALFTAHGIDAPNLSVPALLVKPLAPVVETVWRLLALKSTPPLSRFQLDFIALPRRYKIAKIQRDLGYQPIVSFAQGLAEIKESITCV